MAITAADMLKFLRQMNSWIRYFQIKLCLMVHQSKVLFVSMNLICIFTQTLILGQSSLGVMKMGQSLVLFVISILRQVNHLQETHVVT